MRFFSPPGGITCTNSPCNNGKRVNSDQTPCSLAVDLCLHCVFGVVSLMNMSLLFFDIKILFKKNLLYSESEQS